MLSSNMTRNLTDFEICLQFCVPPCPACGNIIRDNDKAVQCYKKCKRWFHKHCINLRFSVYVKLEERITLRWSCERDDCKGGYDSGDDIEEWPSDKNAELIIPSKDSVLILPENAQYPKYNNNDDLTTTAWKDDITKRLMSQGYFQEKDLIKPKEVAKSVVATELVETVNKKIKKFKRKKKSKSVSNRSIKDLVPTMNNSKSLEVTEEDEKKESNELVSDECNSKSSKVEKIKSGRKSSNNTEKTFKDKITCIEEMDNMPIKPVPAMSKQKLDKLSLCQLRFRKFSLDQINNEKPPIIVRKTSTPERSRETIKSKQKSRSSDHLSKGVLKPILKKTDYKYIRVTPEETQPKLPDIEEKECVSTDYDDDIDDNEFEYVEHLDADAPSVRPITPDSNLELDTKESIVDKIFILEQQETIEKSTQVEEAPALQEAVIKKPKLKANITRNNRLSMAPLECISLKDDNKAEISTQHKRYSIELLGCVNPQKSRVDGRNKRFNEPLECVFEKQDMLFLKQRSSNSLKFKIDSNKSGVKNIYKTHFGKKYRNDRAGDSNT